ncbi:TPA: hypothetical protein N2F01_000101 [Salmonella enterica]|nr:hypothetical protein [Salmonella enterica]
MSQNTLKVHDLNEDAEFDENGVEAFDEKALSEEEPSDNDLAEEELLSQGATQREVLARRFGLLGYEAATLEDVGREIGLTRERVRQIQVEGLRRLREILQTQGLNIEALFRE